MFVSREEACEFVRSIISCHNRMFGLEDINEETIIN